MTSIKTADPSQSWLISQAYTDKKTNVRKQGREFESRTPPAVMLFTGDVHFAEVGRTFKCNVDTSSSSSSPSASSTKLPLASDLASFINEEATEGLQEVQQELAEAEAEADAGDDEQQKKSNGRGVVNDETTKRIRTMRGKKLKKVLKKSKKALKKEKKKKSKRDYSSPTQTSLSSSSLLTFPIVEVTTSGMTHSWGELLGQKRIMTPLTKRVFPWLNKQHITNYFLHFSAHVPGLTFATRTESVGVTAKPVSPATVSVTEPETVTSDETTNASASKATTVTSDSGVLDEQRFMPDLTDEDFQVLENQYSSFYVGRNFASVDLNWGDHGILEYFIATGQGNASAIADARQRLEKSGQKSDSWITVRIRSAQSGRPHLIYPLPFAALRAHRINAAAIADAVENNDDVYLSYAAEATTQCLAEMRLRTERPFTFPLVRALRYTVFGFILLAGLYIISRAIRRFVVKKRAKAGARGAGYESVPLQRQRSKEE